MNITDRLNKYMIYKGLNPNKITVEAGLSVGLIGRAIKNNTGLNSDTIEKILYTYTDLNPIWFILGQGEMLKTKCKENVVKKNDHINDHINDHNPNVKKMWSNDNADLINSLNREIQRLDHQVEELRQDKKALMQDKERLIEEKQSLKEEKDKWEHKCNLAQKEIERLKNVQDLGHSGALVG